MPQTFLYKTNNNQFSAEKGIKLSDIFFLHRPIYSILKTEDTLVNMRSNIRAVCLQKKAIKYKRLYRGIAKFESNYQSVIMPGV